MQRGDSTSRWTNSSTFSTYFYLDNPIDCPEFLLHADIDKIHLYPSNTTFPLLINIDRT